MLIRIRLSRAILTEEYNLALKRKILKPKQFQDFCVFVYQEQRGKGLLAEMNISLCLTFNATREHPMQEDRMTYA